ncbi:MAG: hypothetical protein WCG07_02505 [Candidatus Taylorbacteria bacterium]
METRTPKFVTRTLLDQILAGHGPGWTETHIKNEGRKAAVILDLNPCYPPEFSHQPVELWHGILGEKNPENWDPDRNYHEFALAKARAAWRTKVSNSVMFGSFPELVEKDDFKYIGGINERGLVIAVSGLKSGEIDEQVAREFSKILATNVHANLTLSREDKSSFFF